MTVSMNNGIPISQAAQAAEQQSGWPGWPAWVQHVQHSFKMQQEHIARLQSQLDSLSMQLKAAEAKPTYHIDKIEYQFDQLKIEKLDGTLNIGIQPPADGSESDIDQLIVQQAKNGFDASSVVNSGNGSNEIINNTKPNVFPSAGPAMMQAPPPFGSIQTRINDYLDQNGALKLAMYEAEYNLPLDPYHRRIVIEDIRRQSPTRIQFYLQQAAQAANTSDSNGPTVAEQVTAKTIQDIDMALRQYITKLSGGDASAGGVTQV